MCLYQVHSSEKEFHSPPFSGRDEADQKEISKIQQLLSLHFPEHSSKVVGDGGLQKEISLHMKEL